MAKELAWIIPVNRGDDDVDPDYGVEGGRPHPSHPIVLPPLPGIWPKPGEPNRPVDPGFGVGGRDHISTGPIFIPVDPDNDLPVPPGTIWPPLPPETGIAGKAAILVWVVGVGYRWLIVEDVAKWPPVATPK